MIEEIKVVDVSKTTSMDYFEKKELSSIHITVDINLDSVHEHSKFRLQESDDEIPLTCKSQRNPRMLFLHTPSGSLLDCPLN